MAARGTRTPSLARRRTSTSWPRATRSPTPLWTDFERSALTRSEIREPYGSIALPIVSPEDLLVYKLIAGRTQDWADIENVLAALAIEGRAVDWTYVEGWCAEWDIAERAVRARALQG